MTVRARLKYFDGNNNEVVIGSLDDDGGEGIQDLTLKNSAREYTKVIVSGGNGLFGKFPTDSADSPDVTTQENADGPEIFLEVFNQSTGVFEVRDRVFAESQGTVSDNGNFKHKRLYGFEKFVGRQNVDLTGADSVTTDIEQVLNDALPSGYVADVPAGATVPSVNNYRFNGRRDQVFKDLRENYNFIINFTAETDGSGNYLVKLEPRGFGGIVDTFEKGVDPVFFDKWTKGDELRRITRAEVVGTDSNGNKVSGTASTSPDNGRFIRRNIGYLESDSEAQNIAVNLIAADSDGGSPQSTEHGRVTAPIDRPATSNLNASIQILNDEINVDDSFTVVQQKDFFHQSQTQYSFEFEKELESRERRDKKDLGNRNSELITSESKNASGSTGDTGPKTSGEVGETGPSTSGEVGETGPSTSGQVGDTGPKTAGLVGRGGPTKLVEDAVDTNTFSNGLGTSFQELGKVSQAPVGSNGSSGVVVYVTATNNASVSGTASLVIELGLTVESTEFATVGTNYPTMNYFITDGDAGGSTTLWIPAEISEKDTVKLNGRTKSGNTGAVEFDVTFAFVEKHQHGADPDNSDGATIDVDLHGHNADSDDPNDNTVSIDVDLHGHSADSDDSDTTIDVDLHGHNADSDDSDTTIDVDNHDHDGSSLDVEVDVEDQVNR